MRRSLIHGVRIIKVFKDLNHTQWLSRDRIKAYQIDKLRSLIEHAYNNVLYYRDIMRSNGIKPQDIRDTDDLKYFPILTKEIIRANFEQMIARGTNISKLKRVKTGGTTGKPLTFYQDRNTHIWQEAALLRGWSWADYHIGDKMIALTFYDKISLLGSLRSKLRNLNYLYALAKKDQIIEYSNKIKSIDPFCLSGLTSSLYRNANSFKRFNINGMMIPAIFSYGEMLHDYQRVLLEEVFNSKVYDYYGCNEIGSMAYECENSCKHITDEHVIFETTNSKGANVINTRGDIILTNLNNYAMPFIRYKVGDVGTLSDGDCDCGRKLGVLKSLDGRSQEFLKTSDGNYIPAISFLSFFNHLKGIEHYQIIQSDINNITLKIVKSEYYSTKELESMIRIIKERIGNSVNINIEECDQIPLTARGKTRFVISHLPAEF